MEKWQIDAKEKRKSIKQKLAEKSKEAQKQFDIPGDVIRDFLGKTYGVIDAVDLDNEKAKAKIEMENARDEINSLIMDFIEKHCIHKDLDFPNEN